MCENLKYKKNPKPGVCTVLRCDTPLTTRKAVCDKHAQHVWRWNNPERNAYNNLKSSAAKRKIIFNLTYEEFLAFIATNNYVDEKGVTKTCLHVDRVVDALGYVAGNLQLLTNSENVAKENRRRFVERRLGFATSNPGFGYEVDAPF